jgi:hypothetical protein
MWKRDYKGQAGPDDARTEYHWRLTRGESVSIDFFDGDKVLQSLPLKQDLDKTVGKSRVFAFDATMDGVTIAKDVKWSGESKVILVQGCKKLKFVQFYRDVNKYQPAAGSTVKPIDRSKPWKPDGSAKKYPGTLELPSDASPDSGGMADMPGLTGKQSDSTGELATMVLKRKKGGAGSTYTIGTEFECFICCDGNLLGFVSWGYALTWTIDASDAVTGPVPSANAPVWNDPTAKTDNKVDCST